MRCHFCQREIVPGDPFWWQVIGWAKDRKQGGHNAIFDEQRTGTVMCHGCQTKRRFGGSIGQGDLFDETT
jgi:hypothetical protein